MDLRNNDFDCNEYDDEDISISDKWLLSQFKGYYFEVFKRRGNISNYKIRKKEIIENICDKQWKRILYFLGFKNNLKYENIYDYWWFIWYLPNQLLIIQHAKLELTNSKNDWWIILLKDWKRYWIEILRNKGIKNWLVSFISQN